MGSAAFIFKNILKFLKINLLIKEDEIYSDDGGVKGRGRGVTMSLKVGVMIAEHNPQ